MKDQEARSLELGAGSGVGAYRSGGPAGRRECGAQAAGGGSQATGDRRRGSAGGRRQAVGSGRRGAFSLIELLVVITVIAILAGISLMTLGYVNRKSAAGRARAEVATLAAAVDSFKLDYGRYPASNNLYEELTGTNAVINTNGKVYIEPTPQMLAPKGGSFQFVDPYGVPYNYSTTPVRNRSFFDLWSVPPPPDGDANDPATWIHN